MDLVRCRLKYRVAARAIERAKRAHNGGLQVYVNPDSLDNTVGSRQQEIITGMLLGDSFLERNGRYVRLISDHTAKQKEYVRWQASTLKCLRPTIIFKDRWDKRTSKTYHHCILRTRTSPLLEPFVRQFYYCGAKHVSQNLPDIISPLMLAIWIMDDGYKRSDCNALRINTQGYSLTEQYLIQKALAVLQLQSSIHKHTSHYVVYIPSSSMSRLRSLIAPYLIKEMKYKVA